MPSLTLPSVPRSVSRAVDAVEAAVVECGLSDEVLGRASLAVGEAVANAIEHGNRGEAHRRFGISISRRVGALDVTVCDDGEGVAAQQIAVAKLPDDPLQTDGRGLYMIRLLSDETEVRGSCLRLTFRERTT